MGHNQILVHHALKDLLLVRGQVALEWHSGDWSWGPVASYDLIEDLSDAFYIGVTVGFGF